MANTVSLCVSSLEFLLLAPSCVCVCVIFLLRQSLKYPRLTLKRRGKRKNDFDVPSSSSVSRSCLHLPTAKNHKYTPLSAVLRWTQGLINTIGPHPQSQPHFHNCGSKVPTDEHARVPAAT